MQIFDFSAPTPQENLALDEALLENAENGKSGEVLRFWESPAYFLALGYTNKIALEADLQECQTRKIPILRRSSGGGTVVQGPGCLNYALIGRIPEGKSLDVGATNDLVMTTTRDALQTLISQKIVISGHTDLAIEGRKFSGNAQKRKRAFFLFHGSFLLDFDLDLVQLLLKTPPKMPDYRLNRSHQDFVCNLPTSRESVKKALQIAWKATQKLENSPFELAQKLIEEKYGRDDWNLKF